MRQLLRDVRYGIRTLIRDKSFSAAVIGTLAVCIGANTATLTIVDSVLLRPLPIEDSDSILLMANRYPGAGDVDSNGSGPGDYYDRLRDLSAFGDQAVFDFRPETVEIAGTSEQVLGMRATPSLFRLLRVSPRLGRAFNDEEGEIGADSKVILSDRLWSQLFDRDPSVVGRELRMGGRNQTIVGVMPREFNFVNPDVRFWRPLAFTPEEKLSHHQNNSFLNIGRLEPGATLEQAQAQVDALNAANLDRFPDSREVIVAAGFHTKVLPLQDMIVGDVKGILYMLWGGALFVLLIGALNVVNLVLARLTLKRKELATRQALGARGSDVVRQFAAETTLAALVGGALGVALGVGLLRGLELIGLEQLPRSGEIRMDTSVVLVGMALAGVAGLLTGLAPLGQILRANLSRALVDEGRGGTRGRETSRLRQGLVAAQIGFAFVLLLGAGLLLASVRELLRVDPGFRTDGVLTLSTIAPPASYEGEAELRGLMRRSLEAVRAIPGVADAGATTNIPLSFARMSSVVMAEGHQMEPGESLVAPRQLRVTPGYFEAMGIPMVKGRVFDDRDDESAAPAIIVDERLAERFWPDQDPIGRRMYQPDDPESAFRTDENTRWLTVVGVVRSVHLDDLAGSGSPVGAYYLSLVQSPTPFFTLAVESTLTPDAVASAVRGAMARIDPELAFFDIRTMDERAELSLSSRRTAMSLATGFGGVALFLSAIGIYGLLAYHVTQRRREIGIRVALGSTSAHIVRLVIREGLLLAGVGLALGLAGSLAVQRVMANEIYGVSALEPVVIGSVVLVLVAVVVTASSVPARRASRIDPVRAINSE